MHAWQKSSYCAQGESCVHIARDAETVRLTESADPAEVIVSTTRPAFEAFLRTLKEPTRD
ncbi:DUF397 domain-containing protein [Streptomyces sp. NBC_01304]|uniref:DUF397 domain-containing protein n=1 Tax=Streptomyces sp. NBC_01304 TaxID=2903818 RepID=UPI002E1654BC|nr:DUF397 domain-containing protein [Streptomyces sp. NBC_01304]